ncbi:hypothetical protein [Legionella jordanis]|uniref:Uncharacterized protein n=1 Tax=Legionella jordanis TaxID=456 RepID=A0A0W0VB86_9GAMM|nr:hypothetical protein [Legionella jordanis]KTD17378.1 hypothetical protein Ljor_1684 [Legionella jordanis]RMX01855.1 hypothetical protein EAW55_10140 [Legionella jordanis]RMX17645.1 hypothetical protein EAS68_10155 [Legionella jordanis]VEH11602.1 Uncharacterised protein [Legionella jordanis]HAT8714675.1 hypothetical protein [Legionella jordanis]
MKNRVFFLPKFKPNVSSLPDSEQVWQLLEQAKGHIADIMEQAKQCIQHEPDTLAIILGYEDYFQSGAGHLNHGCVPQEIGVRYFVDVFANLTKGYENIVLIPGSIYLSVDKLEADNKPYRQNGSKNFNAEVYVQNVVPVFFAGKCIRLLKKGDYLSAHIKNPNHKQHCHRKTAISSEADFLHLLTSEECERLQVDVYHEDELEDKVKNCVMFGKTPLPGERQLLERFDLVDVDFFSPKFTIKGRSFGLEICADHQRAFLRKIPALSGLDIHLLSCYGQPQVYDGTHGSGFFIRAEHDSCSILDMRSQTYLDVKSCFEITRDNQKPQKTQALQRFFRMNSDRGPSRTAKHASVIAK